MAARGVSQIQSFINSSTKTIFLGADVHKKSYSIAFFRLGQGYIAWSGLLPLKGWYKYF